MPNGHTSVVPRTRSGRNPPITALPMPVLISQVQFHLNWQWPAIRMQYERLTERAHQPQERRLVEHMQTVGDMDFLVTAVRRLLRTADAALQIRSEYHEQLKLAVKVFKSRWWPSIKEIRDALEHVERLSTGFPVPAVGIPANGNGDGEFILTGSHGNLDLGKMYKDAQSIAKAIASIIEPAEGELETSKRPGTP